MEMKIGEGLKKVLLMGIGAASVTAEKSQQLVDELVKRGELTVEQGGCAGGEGHFLRVELAVASFGLAGTLEDKNDKKDNICGRCCCFSYRYTASKQ